MEEFVNVPIHSIKTNPFQPRRVFNEVELEELSNSIKNVGLIHPPLVRQLEDGCYELIAGERRWRACQQAGFHEIPVIVQQKNDLQSAELALIENIQRVDLDPIEVAAAIQALILKSGWTQERIAEKVGKKRSTIANYLRLLILPPSIKEGLSKGHISVGHAKVLLSLSSLHEMLLLYDKILKSELTVRQTEEIVAKWQHKPKEAPQLKTQNFFLEELKCNLQQKLGTKVEIEERGKKGGRITIEYYNLDDLDRLLEILQPAD